MRFRSRYSITVAALALTLPYALTAGRAHAQAEAPAPDTVAHVDTVVGPARGTAPSAPPTTPDSLYNAAFEVMNSRAFREAAELFRTLIEQHPEATYVPDAHYWRAFALYRLGEHADLQQGLEALQTMRARFPTSFLSADATVLEQRILGELAQRGDPAAAQQIAERAMQLAQAHPEQSARREEAQPTAAVADSPPAGGDCSGSHSTPGGEAKIAALSALAQMSPERALPTLQALLQRQDPEHTCLRRLAIVLLAQLRVEQVEAMLLVAARHDQDLGVRKQAVLHLSQFNTDAAVHALDSLVRTSSEPELVERAVIALSQSEHPDAHRALRVFADREDMPGEARRTTVAWLLARPSAENVAFLRRLYERIAPGDVELRRGIVQAVGGVGDSANAGWLLGVAQGEADSLELRMQALHLAGATATTAALGGAYAPALPAELRSQLMEMYVSRVGQPGAVDALGEVAKQDPDAELRKRAVAAISESQDPRAAEVLQAIVEAP